MRISLLALPCVALLAACGMPDQGYYDANGNYIAPANTTTHVQRTRANAGTTEGSYNNYETTRDTRPTSFREKYDRAGYYDYNGYYIPRESGPQVSADMFPPRGMCRVWFTDRAPEDQPRVESCTKIRQRVPAGAYVIYGG